MTENRGTWSIVKAAGGGAIPDLRAHSRRHHRPSTPPRRPLRAQAFRGRARQNNWRGDAFNYGLTGGILSGDSDPRLVLWMSLRPGRGRTIRFPGAHHF